MRLLTISLFLFCIAGCKTAFLTLPIRPQPGLTGSSFYQQAAAMNWKERDSFAIETFVEGHIPGFLSQLVPVTLPYTDSSNGLSHVLTFYVTPDYFAIGNDDDWARVPLTPMAAQRIADSLHCILPTPAIVDLIYQQAVIKLEPVPFFAYRDSTPIMYHHHLVIEGQRKGKKGLIAGIKKDVVYSSKLYTGEKKNRVAIYGWHKPDGKPIQPLYTGHVNWYVDYSHGIRFVSQQMQLDGKWIDYTYILSDPFLSRLIGGEGGVGKWRY